MKSSSRSIRAFLDSDLGALILSVIVGFGLATLFRKACSGRGCIVIKGPKPSELRKNVYMMDGRCYKYVPEAADCNGKDHSAE